MHKHAKTRGVLGHAPPGKICNLQPRRLHLVVSETSLTLRGRARGGGS